MALIGKNRDRRRPTSKEHRRRLYHAEKDVLAGRQQEIHADRDRSWPRSAAAPASSTGSGSTEAKLHMSDDGHRNIPICAIGRELVKAIIGQA